MVELIRNKEIDIEKIKRERSEFIQEQTEDFQLSEMLLQLSETRFADQKMETLLLLITYRRKWEKRRESAVQIS